MRRISNRQIAGRLNHQKRGIARILMQNSKQNTEITRASAASPTKQNKQETCDAQFNKNVGGPKLGKRDKNYPAAQIERLSKLPKFVQTANFSLNGNAQQSISNPVLCPDLDSSAQIQTLDQDESFTLSPKDTEISVEAPHYFIVDDDEESSLNQAKETPTAAGSSCAKDADRTKQLQNKREKISESDGFEIRLLPKLESLTHSSAEKLDEATLFALSLVPSFKRIFEWDPLRLSELKLDIQRLVLQAERDAKVWII